MFWITRQIILGIHIMLGIIWVGGILFVGWGVFPAMKRLTYLAQQQFIKSLMEWSHHFFSLAGIGVITTGVLLGTIFGPIRTWEFLWTSSYGQLFALAIVIGVLSLLWGVFVSYRFSMKVINHNTLWNMAEDGYPRLLHNALRNVKVVSSIEVIGFIGLITIMVLI